MLSFPQGISPRYTEMQIKDLSQNQIDTLLGTHGYFSFVVYKPECSRCQDAKEVIQKLKWSSPITMYSVNVHDVNNDLLGALKVQRFPHVAAYCGINQCYYVFDKTTLNEDEVYKFLLDSFADARGISRFQD